MHKLYVHIGFKTMFSLKLVYIFGFYSFKSILCNKKITNSPNYVCLETKFNF